MSFTYVDPPNENLVCCICRAPFIDPYTARTCCHTFCCECIVTAISISQQCPIDRSPLTTEDLTPSDPLVRNLVDELIVECPNHSIGCTHSCQRQFVDAHIRESCQFVSVPCPTHQCHTRILKRDIAQHTHNPSTLCDACGTAIDSTNTETHLESCSKTQITCPSCLADIPRSSLPSHESTCPDAIIPCTHSSYGCTWKGRRRSLEDTHISVCPYESIKGFFEVYAKEGEGLKEDNRKLRRRVDELEGVVSVLRREVGVVREALGPWYRSARTRFDAPATSRLHRAVPGSSGLNTPDGSSSTSRTSGTQTPNLATATTTSLFLAGQDIVSPPPPAHFHGGHSTGTGGREATELLASYFPEQIHVDPFGGVEYEYRVPPIPIRPPGGILSGSATPHYAHSSSIAQTPPTVSNPNSNPNVPLGSASASGSNVNAVGSSASVAPLNLSTTLEGSLSGLRESIVSLGASVESMGRQHEVAITTESMRSNEEIRSLRAVVHGLRMQVHSMMMDRNAQVTGRLDIPSQSLITGLSAPRPVNPNANRPTTTTAESNSSEESGRREGPPLPPPVLPSWLPSYPVRFPMVPSSIPITKL